MKVQRLLGDRMGNDIWFYSLTLEPEKDSPEILASYAERFDVGPGWLFLTGNPEDLETLRQNLGFAWSDPVLDADLTNHIGTVKMGNEPRSWWGAAPSLSDPRQIARLMVWMAPEEGQEGTIGRLPGEPEPDAVPVEGATRDADTLPHPQVEDSQPRDEEPSATPHDAGSRGARAPEEARH